MGLVTSANMFQEAGNLHLQVDCQLYDDNEIQSVCGFERVTYKLISPCKLSDLTIYSNIIQSKNEYLLYKSSFAIKIHFYRMEVRLERTVDAYLSGSWVTKRWEYFIHKEFVNFILLMDTKKDFLYIIERRYGFPNIDDYISDLVKLKLSGTTELTMYNLDFNYVLR